MYNNPFQSTYQTEKMLHGYTTLIDLKCTETIVHIAGKFGAELILVILRITVRVECRQN